MIRADNEADFSQTRPLLSIDIVLAIPKITTKPTLEETQAAVSRAVQAVLRVSDRVTQWEHISHLQRKVKNLPLINSVNRFYHSR
jgi:hypothetical protein